MAKLVNKKFPTDKKDMHSQCMYCRRWATSPHNSKSQEFTWKTYDQLDSEEKIGVNNAKKQLSDVSHGICTYCYNILEGLDDPYNATPTHIRELSLAVG